MSLNLAPDASSQTMSSLEIAEATGKRHKHVMADIRKMLNEMEKQPDEFSSDWTDARGRKQKLFALDRFHTEVLVTGYDVKRWATVIRCGYGLESAAPTR